MKLDAIVKAAKDHNDWKVWALSIAPPRSGHNPNGLAVVERPNAPTGREGTEWATVAWASRLMRIEFYSGNYDLTREEAFRDFGERAT